MIVLIIGVLFFTGKALQAEEITYQLASNHNVSNPQIFFNLVATLGAKQRVCCATTRQDKAISPGKQDLACKKYSCETKEAGASLPSEPCIHSPKGVSFATPFSLLATIIILTGRRSLINQPAPLSAPKKRD
jgi:hypothetical protein